MVGKNTEIWCLENEDLIEIDKRILEEDGRGVYSIWVEDECVYVGKGISVKSRILSHLSILKWLVLQIPVKDVPEHIQIMYEFFKENKKIKVKLEERVKYEYDNYYRDLHRLAFCEYKKIEDYQAVGWCLYQRPEGSYNENEYEEWIEKKAQIES
jgi:hypothetical protein